MKRMIEGLEHRRLLSVSPVDDLSHTPDRQPALLLPAIQAAREAATRTSSDNPSSTQEMVQIERPDPVAG